MLTRPLSTGYFDCALAGTTSAVCIESFGGTDANFPGSSTETYTGTGLAFMSVVITAGVTASTSSSPIVPSTTTSGPSATNTSGSSTKTSSAGESTSGANQGISATSSSTGGVPVARESAKWVLGGIAALAILA